MSRNIHKSFVFFLLSDAKIIAKMKRKINEKILQIILTYTNVILTNELTENNHG